MENESSAIATARISPSRKTPGEAPPGSRQTADGTLFAALGVLGFSFSFPATEWALSGFGPFSVTGIRGALAAVIAVAALVVTRAPRPARADWPALATVGAGCVIGFPLLTTFALQTSTTAHSAVVIGLLPMVTAAIAALRTKRHPSKVFWAGATMGAAAVIVFTLSQNHGRPTIADLYLFGGLLACAAGYAEGGRLSARMPGWQVIAWGVALAAPVSLLVCAIAIPNEPVHGGLKAVTGLVYIGAISQLGGFVVWYRGMGLIGVARASQLQLAQPLLTLVWAVLLLGEHLTAAVPVTAVIVLGAIVVTQRARAA